MTCLTPLSQKCQNLDLFKALNHGHQSKSFWGLLRPVRATCLLSPSRPVPPCSPLHFNNSNFKSELRIRLWKVLWLWEGAGGGGGRGGWRGEVKGGGGSVVSGGSASSLNPYSLIDLPWGHMLTARHPLTVGEGSGCGGVLGGGGGGEGPKESGKFCTLSNQYPKYFSCPDVTISVNCDWCMHEIFTDTYNYKIPKHSVFFWFWSKRAIHWIYLTTNWHNPIWNISNQEC